MCSEMVSLSYLSFVLSHAVKEQTFPEFQQNCDFAASCAPDFRNPNHQERQDTELYPPLTPPLGELGRCHFALIRRPEISGQSDGADGFKTKVPFKTKVGFKTKKSSNI